jgi:MoaA/NifB/PqqE/SkfB family radical SAM enzyme
MINEDIKILHIEPTNLCNAACPQCARELDESFDKTDIFHLSISDIDKLINKTFIKNLNKVFMCGNYGDPAAGKYTLELFKYFRSINPNIILGMNTNGGLRNNKWWIELANILNQPQDYVVWSIDGLQDTNHIYRINVNWEIVMNNARAFIDAGGPAHWDMLVFEHNEHQILLAEKLAKTLGFKWFRVKISNRHKIAPVKFLKPPTLFKDPTVLSNSIECRALEEKSLYISAQGVVYPCCWLGVSKTHTLTEFDIVKQSWKSNNPVQVCVNTCSTYLNQSSFNNQWQREVAF